MLFQIPINRCSYAQLMQQVFQADKRSGYTVQKNVGSDYKGMDLGSKIAHGFQILCSGCSEGEHSGFDEVLFQKYLHVLRQRDYFRGEVEGSKLYKELLDNARNYFAKSENESSSNTHGIGKTTGRRILSMMKKSDGHTLSRLVKHDLRTDLPEEDNDEWMYLSKEKMDNVLYDMKQGFAKLNKKSMKPTENSAELELTDLGERMQSFVDKMSSYEGVEVPSSGSEVNFEEDTFVESLEKILGVSDANQSFESDSDEFLSGESDLESEGEEIKDIMGQMDKELASTNIGQSFIKMESNADDNATMDAYRPVDLDMNLVQNFLDSCNSEIDLPGPVSNLLQSLGLPVNEDNS